MGVVKVWAGLVRHKDGVEGTGIPYDSTMTELLANRDVTRLESSFFGLGRRSGMAVACGAVSFLGRKPRRANDNKTEFGE